MSLIKLRMFCSFTFSNNSLNVEATKYFFPNITKVSIISHKVLDCERRLANSTFGLVITAQQIGMRNPGMANSKSITNDHLLTS